MKKLFILLTCLIYLFILASCEDGANQLDIDENSTVSIVDDAELTLEFSFGSRTGVYSGEVNADGIPHGQGKFTSSNTTGESWTYQGNWVNGHFDGFGTTTWSDGSIHSGEYQNDAQSGHGIHIFPNGQRYEGNFSNSSFSGDGTLYYPDGTCFVGNFTDSSNGTGTYYDVASNPYEARIENSELVMTSTVDFFSDTERQQKYKELYESYQYSALAEYINTYISENSPVPTDSAYTILEMIEPLLQYESSWFVNFDSFDSTYTVTFAGATEISDTCATEVTVSGTSLDIKLGFVKNNWLFFDSISISIDGESAYSASCKDAVHDVLSGNSVREYVRTSLYDSVLDEMHGGQTVIARFSNSSSREYIDHTFTKQELDALFCGLHLRMNNRDLSNLLFRYKQNNE